MNFNENQKLAVESTGNVILSAGAGSGKTSVIVGHLLHKIESSLKTEKISDYLAGLHVMTFTNLAANELRQRLRKAFTKKSQEDPRWVEVVQNLDQMFIGTIHSFCLKWLKKFQGEVGLINLQIDTVGLHKRNLEIFCQSFREKHKDNSQISSLFSFYGDAIDVAIKQIFNNPLLRHKCLHADFKIRMNFKNDMELLFKTKKWSDIFDLPISTCDNDKIKSELLELQSLTPNSITTPDAFVPVVEFLKRTKLKRNAKSTITETLNQIAELKTWVKEDWEAIYNYYTLGQKDLGQVHDLIKELARYVDTLQRNTAGITFNDIEYYALSLLSNEYLQKEISEQITYLIVDEFQDTSEVQFSIIRKSIGDNFAKLFIVGDPKQAIYRFRGGDVNIFNYCLQQLKSSLKLDVNYRSSKSIVDFSNKFFEQILGTWFDYPQLSSQDAGPQVVISESQDVGGFQVELPQILSSIDEYWKKDDVHEIAIILRTLKGAQYLFKELLRKNYSFKVQFTQNFSEHPLIELYKAFLFVLNAKEKEIESTQLYLSKILKLWGAQKTDFDISSYQRLVGYYPLDYLFHRFLKDLGLYWFLSQDQLNSLSAISRGCEDISEVVATINNSDYRSKINLNFGNSGKEILIMTAHSTKGLEFDAVIVADTSSAPNYQASSDKIFGRDWDSFSWKDRARNKKYKSISYVIDREVESEENEAEYRRLLYVAITRAKKYLSIVLSKGGNPRSVWGKMVVEAAANINYPLTVFEKIDDVESIEANSPNWLHVFNGKQSLEVKSDRYVISDLSVSRLSTLALCPRKYYFENILKLDPKILLVDKNKPVEVMKDTDKIYSSSERGSNLHYSLSRYLKKMITSFSEIKILDEDKLKLEWCLKYLAENNLVDYSVSESEIKFPWNKIILNGTPDLYGKSKTHQWVVDFKTGDIDQAKMVQYQAQLMLYSYGLNQLNYFDESLPIENYLIFLDRSEVKKFVYQKQEIKQSIDSLLFKMKDLSLINVDHCSQCQFQKICY